MNFIVLTYSNTDFDVTISAVEIEKAWERFQGRILYRNQVVPDETEKSDPMAYCSYQAEQNTDIRLYDYETHELVAIESGKKYWPVLFETCSYEISILFKHVDYQVPKAIHVRQDVVEQFSFFWEGMRGDDGKLIPPSDGKWSGRLSRNIDFLNEPGLFRLGFEYVKDGKTYRKFISFDVVSPKLDIKTDYHSILRDVNREFEQLVFRYYSLTMQQMAEGKEKNLNVWMEIFESVVLNYLKNVDRIIKNPNSRTRTDTLYAHADRIKRWTPAMEEEYSDVNKAERLEKHYFRYQVYDNTVNTMENRFVKYTLQQIDKKLDRVFNEVLTRNETEISETYRNHWHDYRHIIKRYLKHPFFQAVGKFEGMRQESLVLQSRMGYQQVYKDWLKLKKGIDFYQGLTNVGTLQIWEIYELWCFIKVKQMILKVLRIDPMSDLIEEPHGPLISFQRDSTANKIDYRISIKYPTVEETDFPELHVDDADFVRMINQHKGETISLHYQHTYSRQEKDDCDIRTFTTEQRPDIILNIHKTDGSMLTYLYDAKYRVHSDTRLDGKLISHSKEDDEFYLDDTERKALENGADYPPADAINQMHRYRDAVYYNMVQHRPESKEVIGGYILFPGRGDDTSISTRFYSKSIEQVNIGAFALLPYGQKPVVWGSLTEEQKRAYYNTPDIEGPQLYRHLTDILLSRTSMLEHVENSVPQRGLFYTDEESHSVSRKWSRTKVLIFVQPKFTLKTEISGVALGFNYSPFSFEQVSLLSKVKYVAVVTTNIPENKVARIFKIDGAPSIVPLNDEDIAQGRYFHRGFYKEKEDDSNKNIELYLKFAFSEELSYPVLDLDKIHSRQFNAGEEENPGSHNPRICVMSDIIKQ